MQERGEITVFLAMILLSMCALLCGIVESVRTAGGRYLLRTAMDSSMGSLLAQYHQGLWESTEFWGWSTGAERAWRQSLPAFSPPISMHRTGIPWKSARYRSGICWDLRRAADSMWSRRSWIYMRYGLVGALWDAMDEQGAGELLALLKEGEGVSRISDLYEGHAKEAVRLEAALERIETRLISQKENWQEGAECLEDLEGDEFVQAAEAVIEDLEKIPGLVEAYEEQADRLRERLEGQPQAV